MAPIAHVGGQGIAAVGLGQIAVVEPGLQRVLRGSVNVIGDRATVRLPILLRVFHRAFENQDGHGIEVAGLDLAAQAQPFQRDGSAAGEGVEELGRLPAVAVQDALARSFQQIRPGESAASA